MVKLLVSLVPHLNELITSEWVFKIAVVDGGPIINVDVDILDAAYKINQLDVLNRSCNRYL